MNRHPTLPRLLVTLGLLLASSLVAAASPVNTGLFGKTAVKGYDVVAYHSEKRAVKGDSEYSASWQGANWHFVSAANRDRFKANPARYAPQYGGYCAFAVAKNDLVGIDPEAYTLVGDKLYLNYSKDIQRQWEADRQRFIESADRNFPALIAR
jgi:YHS domain-containing protein